MKRFLTVLSLGVVLATGAQAELDNDQKTRLRSMYYHLLLSDPMLKQNNTAEQADFVFDGLQSHDLANGVKKADIVSLIMDNKRIEDIYEKIRLSDPAFNYMDVGRQSEYIYEYLKRLDPDSNIEVSDVKKVISLLKDDHEDEDEGSWEDIGAGKEVLSKNSNLNSHDLSNKEFVDASDGMSDSHSSTNSYYDAYPRWTEKDSLLESEDSEADIHSQPLNESREIEVH